MVDWATSENDFFELSVEESQELDGGFVVEAVVGALLYLLANEVCEDFTGKTIGKAIADELFPPKQL